MMKKVGVIKDGKLNSEKVSELISKNIADQKNAKTANEIAKNCENVTSSDDSECTLAVEITNCVVENAIELQPDWKTYVNECKTQYNVDFGQILAAIANRKLPEAENGKCFVACVMKKFGAINNGKLDIRRMTELNTKKFTNPEQLGKAQEIIKRCAGVKAADGNDCTLAIEIAKCAMLNAIELNFEVPDF